MTHIEDGHQPFRSATEFPKTIQDLETAEADRVYREIRNYLISTNRSQGQLRRYNQNYRKDIQAYKAEIGELRDVRDRLQLAINNLATEKQDILVQKGQAITLLQSEVENLTSHLDNLADAFDGVIDFNDSTAQWGSQSFVGRVRRFLNAVRHIVLWWRKERTLPPSASPQPQLPPNTVADDDRRDNPQMYTDPASVNRALSDDVG